MPVTSDMMVTGSLRRLPGALSALQPVRELSEVEDVDVAEAIMDLRVEEVAYEATLLALARCLPDTLLSFLR